MVLRVYQANRRKISRNILRVLSELKFKARGVTAMDDPIAFVTFALLILLTPGPTNTLLAVAGASQGLRASIVLVPAEVLGYAISILCITLLLGTFVEYPFVTIAIRFFAALYLFSVATYLWRIPSDKHFERRSITFSSIFITTILNPKGVLFSLVVMPQNSGVWLEYFLALMVLIMIASISWIVTSSLMHTRLSVPIVRRAGAAVISLFAAVLIVAPFI
ncbi:LysE family transporter [Mesorhizobium sp. M0618]|uniref:LysE family translocator n=1 Tax=unclassified Mesorhizobium TaxID=325217 RepID=UPI0033387D7A